MRMTDGDRNRATGRSRASRILSSLGVIAVAASLLAACTTEADDTVSKDSRGPIRLYTGPMPEPAYWPGGMNNFVPALPDMSEMPEPPEPPEDFSDEAALDAYMKAMEEYSVVAEEFARRMQEALEESDIDWEALAEGQIPEVPEDHLAYGEAINALVEATRNSDEASVAAWQTLLVASDIAVGIGDEEVTLGERSGFGYPMSMPDVRMQAMIGASEARFPLSELAAPLVGLGFAEEEGLQEAIYDDLRQSGGTDFGVIFFALGGEQEIFDRERYGDYVSVPPDEVRLTAAQTSLALRRLFMELMMLEDEWMASPEGGGGGLTRGFGFSRMPSGAVKMSIGDSCIPGEGYWQSDPSKRGFFGDLQKAFPKTAAAVKDFIFKSGTMGLLNAAASASMALPNFLADASMITADFSMSNSPLVRTKSSFHAGEQRDVTVTVTFEESSQDDARRCLAQIYGLAHGVENDGQKPGAAEGHDVQFVTTHGERLWLAGQGSSAYIQKTDANGRVVFPVEGKPQKKELPDGAEEDDVTSPVRADVNVRPVELDKDLKDVISKRGNHAQNFLELLARMRLISFEWNAPVRDWKLDAVFEAKITGDAWAHSATFQTSNGECGSHTSHRSVSQTSTFEPIDPVRVRVEYLTDTADGEKVDGMVFRTVGMEWHQVRHRPGTGATLTHLPVRAQVTKTVSEPGIDPMPEHWTDPRYGSCGDGSGAGLPQPDCDTRSFSDIYSVNALDGRVVLSTQEEAIGTPWRHCGGKMNPREPVAPPSGMTGMCADARISGGEMPEPQLVFSEHPRFEITGAMQCDYDGNGYLQRYTIDWTMEFCRVVDDVAQC